MPRDSTTSRTVICGIDGSARSRDVARLGAEMASALGTGITLVHVCRNSASGVAADAMVHSAVLRGYTMLQRISEDLEMVDRAELVVEIEVPDDPRAIADRLIDLAAERRASMLVVGSRSGAGLVPAAMGRVCGELARTSPCPVCVLPRGAALDAWALDAAPLLLCGVDGSEEARAAATNAAALTRSLSGRLLLAHVHPERRDGLDPSWGSLRAPLRSRPFDHDGAVEAQRRQGRRFLSTVEDSVAALAAPEQVLLAGDPAEELEALAARSDARILFVGSRGMGSVAAAMLGSVSSVLVASSRRPVVVLPPPAVAAASVRSEAGLASAQ